MSSPIRLFLSTFPPITSAILGAGVAAGLALSPALAAQTQSRSNQQTAPPNSSSSSTPDAQAVDNTPTRRIAQPEAGGSAITLETSEPLFYLSASLNACGYDNGLAESAPIRRKIREEMNDELASNAPARDARDALCAFIRQHTLNDPGLSLAQYVSLALYVTPPPELTTSVDTTELPPDSAQVAEVLPLVRDFAEAIHLNALWFEHHAEYESLTALIHDPLTKMVLDTNIPEGSDGKFNTGDVYTVTGRSVLVLAHVDEPAA